MAGIELSPEQLEKFIGLLVNYIEEQRKHYRPAAAPLPPSQRTGLAKFFPAAIMDTRVLKLEGERVPNPEFLSVLKIMGIGPLLDPSSLPAVTFVDVIVFQVPYTPEMLFHELVHAEQFRQLGTQKFMQHYVKGFLASGRFEDILLERHGFELARRYAQQPQEAFSVAAAVQAWIEQQYRAASTKH